MRSRSIVPLLALAALGCGKHPAPAAPAAPPAAVRDVVRLDPAAYLSGDPVEAMHRATTAVLARGEDDAQEVEVRQVLIGFQGVPKLQGVTRSREEAEQLAARLYRRVLSGEPLKSLIDANSDDHGSGDYVMTTDDPPGGSRKYWRRTMVKAFGDLAWRLAPGEVAVAEYDPTDSKFGWHIIERVR